MVWRVIDGTTLVDHQLADGDQARPGHVARESEQAGGMYLVAVAELIGGAQQTVLDLLVQRALVFFE